MSGASGDRDNPSSEEAEAPRGKVLGLDLGSARIGVAVSDENRRVAVPLGTIRAGAPQDLRAIRELVAEHAIAAIVVGHPRALSGEVGEQAEHAETFAEALRAAFGLPVHLQDERLTTVQAERGLREAGLRGRERRRVVDQAAAALILQSFLDRRL